MLADILTSAASWHNEHPLLTYSVPAALEPELHSGQLVAVPYGNRLVEGIVWSICPDEEIMDAVGVVNVASDDESIIVKPIHSIVDSDPILLPHQMALAMWMAEYYVTPLSQVVSMMLPRALVKRSQFVLRLTEEGHKQGEAFSKTSETSVTSVASETPVTFDTTDISLRLRALTGLLLSDGELDIEQLKKMLGPTKTKELLKEIGNSALVVRDARLEAPRVKALKKRIVRLALQGEALETWRSHTNAIFEQSLAPVDQLPMAPDNVRRRPIKGKKGQKASMPNPWALPDASSLMTLTPQDQKGLLAQRQLAAIELLLHSASKTVTTNPNSYWTPNKLCEATKLSPAQFQQLIQEGILAIETVEIRRDPLLEHVIPPSFALTLTADQQRALNSILESPDMPILLHGVTGSGKTEVYLQALAIMIAQGKRGIVLVPEIALTTQAVLRIAGRFPGRVAIIHGSLSDGERYDEWRQIRDGKVDIVIGARSALFSPLANLGIIILDEEHESAYKQSELKPTYHAREAAIMLGQLLRIPIVLGSATPAVESFFRAEQGNYRLVELPARIGATLPPVEVIDLRNELHAGNTSIISRRLQEELTHVLANKQQAILFLNRRGAASCVLCRDCGFVAMCDRCDIPLTYHSTERILLCHYCGQTSKVLQFCPNCKSSGIRYFGIGTEKVEDTIQRSFPNARLLRWDRDTARNRHAHEQLLDRFASREADILIGTQMIAKGLDLPGVTLVGVVSADIALNLPDYAAPERAFTLLTQVAGRAGRGTEAGRVIIQTFSPQHFCVDAASRHDYHEFYNTEIEARQRYGYPPFRQFVKFTYSHENRHRSQNEALLLCERLNEWIERLALPNTDIVGPAPALIERIKNKYRWQIIARGPDLHQLLRVIDAPGWDIDIDPTSTV